jgi:hypothetical protein
MYRVLSLQQSLIATLPDEHSKLLPKFCLTEGIVIFPQIGAITWVSSSPERRNKLNRRLHYYSLSPASHYFHIGCHGCHGCFSSQAASSRSGRSNSPCWLRRQSSPKVEVAIAIHHTHTPLPHSVWPPEAAYSVSICHNSSITLCPDNTVKWLCCQMLAGHGYSE